MRKPYQVWITVLIVALATAAASAQSFRVQCPTSTITHPITVSNCGTNPTAPGCNNSEPAYNGPTQFTAATAGLPSGTSGDFVMPTATTVNGAIKCQQISGGDGYSTMGDGNQIFMFSFGPLSGLADIAAGHPGTQFPNVFNTPYPGVGSTPLVRGDPATTDGATSGAVPWTGGPALPVFTAFTWNGAVGLTPDIANIVTVTNLIEGPFPATTPATTAPGCTVASTTTVTAWTDAPLGLPVGAQVAINAVQGLAPTPAGYAGTWTISCVASGAATTPDGFTGYAFQYIDSTSGLAADTGNDVAATASSPAAIDGHVDPRPIMDIGVMNGNIPAPLFAFDEDDEFFLTLTNVGMIMRPDLFEQHTVHFHGYPNASSFYDGVPDASVAINIGASFTYYYLAPDAGTYFWHCHITPPEHLQMGMVGQLYVRPRQDRVPSGGILYAYLGYQNGISLPATNPVVDLRTVCNPANDILCSASMPAINTAAARPAAGTLCSGASVVSGTEGTTPEYVYNDGDGSTCYDVTYPIQMHGFDPNFHFVGMTFNPEMFVDMNDKYFLLNGRSYPDTVAAGPQATVSSDGQMHYSQPLPAIINIPAGGKASLRLVNLSVAEYFTLQSLGVPMHEVGFNAKLLRDQDGNSTEFYTNSITLGGGESLDVILDASDDGCSAYLGAGCATKLYPAGSKFYVYSSNLEMLSNDAENFGGMMTEVNICNSVSSDTFGNTCN
ncbi:MAG: multicopper oxidase domain-containing protein [Acidobacteriota bacterium]|nr:multicopper oxidase domain-containing protein [Acidobacteriota bacterium]